MKIIKDGVLPNHTSRDYSGVCDNCKTHIHAKGFELIIDRSLNHPNYRMKCPTVGCSSIIMFHEIQNESKLLNE